MKRVTVAFLIAFAIFFVTVWGRDKRVDSLLQIINHRHLSDRAQALLYAEITELYCGDDMPNTLKYGTLGLEAARRCDDKELIFRFYNYIGSTYTYRCSYDTAKIYVDLQLAAAQASHNQKLVQKAYQAQGNFYARQGLFILAIEGYLGVLRHFDGDEGSRDYILAHGNIGECHRRLGNPKRAIRYLEKERDLAEKYGELTAIGQSYRELGYVYLALGDVDKALEHMLKVLPIGSAAPVGRADVNEALVRAYLIKGLYKEALASAAECKASADLLGDPYIYVLAWNAYADIYRVRGNYPECYTSALKAWKIDSTSLNTAPISAFNTAFAASMLGKRDEAAYFFGVYERLMKERSEKNYQEALSQMEVIYDVEKKQQEISALRQEKRLYTIVGVSGGIILLLIVGLLGYRHRTIRQKRLLAVQEVQRLKQEKQLVASLALLDGENAERTRLARDLHDGLGSMLSVTRLHLHGIKDLSSLTRADIEKFEKARGMLDELMEELRHIAHNMMPTSLSHYGVKTSLEDFCRSIPMVDFQFLGDDSRLDSRLEILIYRCAYELINNAMKHAKARHIHVQLTIDRSLITLSVQDDGKGFDPQRVTYGAGFTNMRNRIAAYNGKINVYSSVGSGTEITIEIEFSS